jgi:hypothetical protein
MVATHQFLHEGLLARAAVVFCGLLAVVGLAHEAWAQAPDRPADASTEPQVTTTVRRDGEFFSVTASAVLPIRRSVAWEVLTDYDHYADFAPDIDLSRVLSRSVNGIIVEQKGRMTFLFFSQPVEARLAVIESPPSLVSTRSLSGNLRDFNGHYRLTEVAGGVRVDYDARFVPEFDLPPLLGPAVVRHVLERTFSAVLKEMLRRGLPPGAKPASSSQAPVVAMARLPEAH